MVRPYDPSESAAQHAFESLPSEWQIDETVQILFERMFSSYADDWDAAHDVYDQLANHIYDEYGEDIDAYFDWEDWRENYDLTH